MTDRFTRFLIAAGAAIAFGLALFFALTGCLPQEGGDNAPEAQLSDGGTDHVEYDETAEKDITTDRQLARQMCEGECSLKRAAGCDTLDSAYEMGYCVYTQCPAQVAAIPDRCIDEYIALRLCIAYSPAPTFRCTTGSSLSSPTLVDPSRCWNQSLALTACRLVG